KSQPEITNPSELAGIVIIDELDLHLHPKWQYELPQMLVNTFPKIQFIVSTHSVIPFLGAPENSVFLKVTRDKENGTKVHKIEDLDIKNLTPNSILTSPIFDMDVITQINNENKEEIHTEENYDAILKRKETQKKLKELAKDFQFPENPS
ncbi:MAG: putative ATP-binding protein involved in virulence, partial [Flammeovirgaceae bacterium]